jgi:hypothetical protein
VGKKVPVHVEPEPPALVDTDPPRAIKMLELQLVKLERLDPSDRSAVEDAQSYLLDDVGRVFGTGSAEWSRIWQENIINEPTYLGMHDDGDFAMDNSWGREGAAKKIKAGIEKMLPRIRELIDRARDRAALHEGDAMNPFKVLPHESFSLIKPTASDTPVAGSGPRAA